MLDQFFSNPAALARLHAGPLGPHMDRFASLLWQRGYAQATLQKQLRGVADFSRWLQEQGLRVDDLDEQSLCGFEQQAPGSREAVRKLRAVFPVMLKYLHEIGVIAASEPSPPESALDCALDEFSQYLTQQRSLAASTISKYRRVIRTFLSERFGSGPIVASELTAMDVRQFVLRRTQAGGNARDAASALRSFLRAGRPWCHPRRPHVGRRRPPLGSRTVAPRQSPAPPIPLRPPNPPSPPLSPANHLSSPTPS
ncbi:MAG: site-specific integrase [bacterium]|nr:site-specific integrase [bacterium]